MTLPMNSSEHGNGLLGTELNLGGHHFVADHGTSLVFMFSLVSEP